MLSLGLKVMWMARCKYVSNSNIKQHSHDFYHYIYVVDGSGIININGTLYTLQKKHLYLTPANISHSFSASENDNLHVIEIKFSLSDPPIIDKVDQLPHVMEDDSSGIVKSLKIMLEEGLEQYGLYTDIINIKLSEVLLYLIKKNMLMNQPPKELEVNSYFQNKDDYFWPVISYMSENIHQSIDLDTLSGIMHLNKSYFCKLFKTKYGVSPIHYLNEMKINKAKELLQYSDMNITEISYNTGFQTVHYFSRFFTQKEGITPFDYRHKTKNNVYIFLD